MGPIVTDAAQAAHQRLHRGRRAEGAQLLVDGAASTVPAGRRGLDKGFWLGRRHPVRPRDAGMKIYREEIFGPVLACVRACPTSRPRSS